MTAGLRCAVQVRAQGADPGGSAGSHDGWALAAAPLPWPPDIDGIESLDPVRRAVRGAPGRIRLQAVVPGEGRPAAVLHRRPPGPFSGYARQEGDDMAALLAAPVPTATSGVRDVLVCTHGRRDRCCGSLGTVLWMGLDADLDPGVALWRTSHTGGHRFAPTLAVLPEGTMWAFADATTVARILARRGPVADVLGCYRGCSGLPGPEVQVLERAVLGEVGWSLLDTPRTGGPLGAGRWVLEVGGVDPSRWEATVTAGRTWRVPTCGEPIEGATKSGTALDVVGLTRVA